MDGGVVFLWPLALIASFSESLLSLSLVDDSLSSLSDSLSLLVLLSLLSLSLSLSLLLLSAVSAESLDSELLSAIVFFASVGS